MKPVDKLYSLGYITARVTCNMAYSEEKASILMGCTRQEPIEHLERNFKEGMSWENYGTGGWQIDHIKPSSSFNLTNIEEQKICFNRNNLQPLWAEENQAKGATLNCKDC